LVVVAQIRWMALLTSRVCSRTRPSKLPVARVRRSGLNATELRPKGIRIGERGPERDGLGGIATFHSWIVPVPESLGCTWPGYARPG